MKIYHYHPITKEYMGEGMADESPLEKGVYLIPANATLQIPRFEINKATIFTGSWEHVDIDMVAKQDINNSSPSTETAYQQVVGLLNILNEELLNVKNQLVEKEGRLSVLEGRVIVEPIIESESSKI